MLDDGLAPQALETRPVIPDHLLVFWKAWITLGTTRPVSGMGGLTTIPWTAVDRYAIRHEITGQAFEDFWFIIQVIDRAFIDESSTCQREREEQAKRNKPNG
jgi:hypothetical protein